MAHPGAIRAGERSPGKPPPAHVVHPERTRTRMLRGRRRAWTRGLLGVHSEAYPRAHLAPSPGYAWPTRELTRVPRPGTCTRESTRVVADCPEGDRVGGYAQECVARSKYSARLGRVSSSG